MAWSRRVEARGLRKVFPGGIVAVDGIDLEAGRGVTVLMGPNGSGKTTTLMMVAGVLKPSSGTVRVCGYDVWGRGWREARACIGFSPQGGPFREKLTALENLVWYGLVRGLSLTVARREARRLLELVGLEAAARRKVVELSGGMRRRLSIAAALMGEPEVLVLDEPSSGLDPVARARLWSLLSRLARERAILASTHLPEEAEEHADTVYMLYRGRVVAKGRPRDLVQRYAPRARIVVRGSGLAKPPLVEGAALLSAGTGEAVYAVDDPEEALPRLVEALLAAGVRVERIEVGRPGLAEAFLALTGETPYRVVGGRDV